MKYRCLCCGNKTLPYKAEECVAFICPMCFWENDVFMDNMHDITEQSDSNSHMTLEQARNNYKEYGVCNPEIKSTP